MQRNKTILEKWASGVCSRLAKFSSGAIALERAARSIPSRLAPLALTVALAAGAVAVLPGEAIAAAVEKVPAVAWFVLPSFGTLGVVLCAAAMERSERQRDIWGDGEVASQTAEPTFPGRPAAAEEETGVETAREESASYAWEAELRSVIATMSALSRTEAEHGPAAPSPGTNSAPSEADEIPRLRAA